jgi:hypothetical protein
MLRLWLGTFAVCGRSVQRSPAPETRIPAADAAINHSGYPGPLADDLTCRRFSPMPAAITRRLNVFRLRHTWGSDIPGR